MRAGAYVKNGVLACEVCGAPATHEAVFATLSPLPSGHPLPPNGWDGIVQVCTPCATDNVSPGWTIREIQIQ